LDTWSVTTAWIGSKQEPSVTFTKDRPPLDSRMVLTQPRTVTVLPASSLPERACFTLTTAIVETPADAPHIGA
jgi:hypothetical protein